MRSLKKTLNIKTYFYQPYHSRKKGLVEQINGLIRHFLPKKNRYIKDHKKGNKRNRIFIKFMPKRVAKMGNTSRGFVSIQTPLMKFWEITLDYPVTN